MKRQSHIADDRGIRTFGWILQSNGDTVTVKQCSCLPFSEWERGLVNQWFGDRGINVTVLSVAGTPYVLYNGYAYPVTTDGVNIELESVK